MLTLISTLVDCEDAETCMKLASFATLYKVELLVEVQSPDATVRYLTLPLALSPIFVHRCAHRRAPLVELGAESCCLDECKACKLINVSPSKLINVSFIDIEPVEFNSLTIP